MPNSPVDWELAERVAVRASGQEPFSSSYLGHSLQKDFEAATAEAEELVAETTGLRSLSGPARARVTDRAGWVHANVNSFQRLLRPLSERLGDRMGDTLRVEPHAQGRRARGRLAPRLDVGSGAGSVRPAGGRRPRGGVP